MTKGFMWDSEFIQSEADGRLIFHNISNLNGKRQGEGGTLALAIGDNTIDYGTMQEQDS